MISRGVKGQLLHYRRRRVLVILANSVLSERLFSATGLFVMKKRIALGSEMGRAPAVLAHHMTAS